MWQMQFTSPRFALQATEGPPASNSLLLFRIKRAKNSANLPATQAAEVGIGIASRIRAVLCSPLSSLF
jgi:hypothetical protein